MHCKSDEVHIGQALKTKNFLTSKICAYVFILLHLIIQLKKSYAARIFSNFHPITVYHNLLPE